jgi:Phosphoinositide 3-kinase family, accessory domain (PIK domain)
MPVPWTRQHSIPQMLVCTYPQVRGQAVEVLQRAEDDELACYLLQLTAALRYEPSDSSRLARFLVERWAARFNKQPAVQTLRCSDSCRLNVCPKPWQTCSESPRWNACQLRRHTVIPTVIPTTHEQGFGQPGAGPRAALAAVHGVGGRDVRPQGAAHPRRLPGSSRICAGASAHLHMLRPSHAPHC